MPNYDEYTVGYRDRGRFASPRSLTTPQSETQVAIGNVVLAGGRIGGYWRRAAFQDQEVAHVRSLPVRRGTPSELAAAVTRDETFLGHPAEIAVGAAAV